jgi:hypothetical protein
MRKAYPRLRERMGRAVRKRRLGSRVAGLSGAGYAVVHRWLGVVPADQMGGRPVEEELDVTVRLDETRASSPEWRRRQSGLSSSGSLATTTEGCSARRGTWTRRVELA